MTSGIACGVPFSFPCTAGIPGSRRFLSTKLWFRDSAKLPPVKTPRVPTRESTHRNLCTNSRLRASYIHDSRYSIHHVTSLQVPYTCPRVCGRVADKHSIPYSMNYRSFHPKVTPFFFKKCSFTILEKCNNKPKNCHVYFMLRIQLSVVILVQ